MSLTASPRQGRFWEYIRMNGYIDNEYTRPRLGRSRAAATAAAATTPSRMHAAASVRRFSHVLLATLLSTLIVIADRMVDAWTSGGLLLALVALWLSVYLGLELFSRISGRLALWMVAAWRDLVRAGAALEPGARRS
jgi:hypothetical protein